MSSERTGFCTELQRRYGRPGDKPHFRAAPDWNCGHQEFDRMQLSKEAPRGEVCDKCRQKDDNEIGEVGIERGERGVMGIRTMLGR